MKFIIEHGKTKRVIEGSFNLCISQADLFNLYDQLRTHHRMRDESDISGAGWVSIYGDMQEHIVNTSPKGWDE